MPDSPFQRLLLSRILDERSSGPQVALEEASKTTSPLPISSGSPGMPPSSRAAEILQTWYPKGLTVGSGINQAPDSMYKDLKRQAERSAAIELLRSLNYGGTR